MLCAEFHRSKYVIFEFTWFFYIFKYSVISNQQQIYFISPATERTQAHYNYLQMKNAVDKTRLAFQYIRDKFSRISEAKVK